MKRFSRRSFLSQSGKSLAVGRPLVKSGSFSPWDPPVVDPINRKTRSHPAEGLKRENITITDIKVTPLSYVHQGAYLWRCAGLHVWKADAALVEVFTNQGITGIAEGSPYRGPDKLKTYTDRYITPLLKGANVFDVDFLTNNQGHNSIAEGAWAGL